MRTEDWKRWLETESPETKDDSRKDDSRIEQLEGALEKIRVGCSTPPPEIPQDLHTFGGAYRKGWEDAQKLLYPERKSTK